MFIKIKKKFYKNCKENSFKIFFKKNSCSKANSPFHYTVDFKKLFKYNYQFYETIIIC